MINITIFAAKVQNTLETAKLFQKKVYLCTMNEQKRQDKR